MTQKGQIRRGYRITGRVQGVGFRFFVLTEATRLDVRGWARNTTDGGVEIEAEGSAEALSEFEQRIARGPPSARVQQVMQLKASNHPMAAGFEIVR